MSSKHDIFRSFLESTRDYLADTVTYIDDWLTADLLEPTEPETPTEPEVPTEPEAPTEPEPEPEPVPPVEPEPTLSYIERTYSKSLETVTIYVSSYSGSDTNDGLSESAPVRTIAKGLSLLRNGKPDWLLFKRGDVWNNETFGNIELSGATIGQPMLFGSYGDVNLPRPRFNTGATSGLNTFAKGSPPREPLSLDYLVFVGLHFCAHTRVPGHPDFNSNTSPTGIRWLRGTRKLTIDDCKFEYYKTNIVIQTYNNSDINDVTIKNSVVLNAYSHSPNSGHSQGLYADGIDGLFVSNCVFDNNGFNNDVGSSEPTIYNHNLYIQRNCADVGIHGNIISRASSHGCQLRPGGIASDNFFYRNPINLLVGYQDPAISADVRDNVIVEGTNISDSLPRVWGIDFNKLNPEDVTLRSNYVLNKLHDSVNSRSVEIKSSVHYYGNVVYNWAPDNILNDPTATYKDVDASIEDLGITPSMFYNMMRRHSMDSVQFTTQQFTSLYKNAFQKV